MQNDVKPILENDQDRNPVNSVDFSKMIIDDAAHKANHLSRFDQNKQRPVSVFTANPISATKFNVSASPFVSSSIQHSFAISKDLVQNNNHIGAPVQPVSPISHYISQTSPHQLHCENRIPRNTSTKLLTSPIYSYEDEISRFPPISPAFPLSYSSRRSSSRDFNSSRCCGPIVLPNGIIQIRLRDGMRVDMTLDKAIRIVNQYSNVAISLSSNGSSSALIHPNGRVYQYGSRVEIVAYDGMKTNNYVRYAKMWYKGVSFTSEKCALTYLVDAAGTRTTSDTFTDMSRDYTMAVLYNDSRHGSQYSLEATNVLQDSKFQYTGDGTEMYEINGFRISQTADGLVKITRNNNKCLIRTSPGNGSATLTTPIIHCTASLGKTSHLFVRRGERRMHFDGSSFVVRNSGHSAGFDENNLLNVY